MTSLGRRVSDYTSTCSSLVIMKKFLIKFIKLYQYTLSPDKNIFWPRRKTCLFYPTCSDYAIEAIKKYGSIKGVVFSIKRLVRCHPWQEPKVDKLP